MRFGEEIMRPKIPVVLLAICLAASGVALMEVQGQEPAAGTDIEITGHSFIPERLNFSLELMQNLSLPEGFEVNVFARDLKNPRMIAVGDDGTVYVTEPAENRTIALVDVDGDGISDRERVVASELAGVHGIAVHGGKLYLATPTELYVAEIGLDGEVGEPQILVDDLPDGGQHPNRTFLIGPDGRIYLSVGSTCNACIEPNPEHATILQIEQNGSSRRIYARGLRNTLGFAMHPVTGEMWGVDQGTDWLGDDEPPEELNRIVDGKDYGWPWCYGKGQVDEVISQKPENMTKEEYCSGTEPSVLEYQAHSSPIQLVFYNATQFPEEYRNDAFVTFRGSWNREPAVGYKVVRVLFDEAGEPTGFEDFLTGFLVNNGTNGTNGTNGIAFFARPAGMAVAWDGSLLVGDDVNGVIYRISYRGNEAGTP